MEFLVFMFGLIMFMSVLGAILADENDDQQKENAKLIILSMADFIYYCDNHKDALPENVRESFDKMEKEILSRKLK